MPEKKENPIGDALKSAFVYIFSAAIILAAVLFSSSNDSKKSILGFRFYDVLTGSMEPTYMQGDMIIVKIVPPEDIQVGDPITFNPFNEGDTFLTHRVTERIDDYEGTGEIRFRTKGDSNDSEDSFLVKGDHVIGKVVKSFKKMGFVIRYVRLAESKWYIFLPLLILVIIFFKLIGMYIRAGREEDEDENEGETEDSTQNSDEM